jgi:hypothetical protein
MKQDTALKQRKACLSIRTAFDPLHFVHKPLDHAVAPRLATSIGDSFCIIGQPVDKLNQFHDPTRQNDCFPLLQAKLSLVLAQQLPKVLRQRESFGDCGVALRKIGRLFFGAVVHRSNGHESGASGGKGFPRVMACFVTMCDP